MRGPQTARTNRARSLRKADNDAERALWSELRGQAAQWRKVHASTSRSGLTLPTLPVGKNISSSNWMAASMSTATTIAGAISSWSIEGWSVLRFWNVDALKERDAVVDTILAALDRRLDRCRLRQICASRLRQITGRQPIEAFAAPHPYPLPVKNGERGASAFDARSPRERGEGSVTMPWTSCATTNSSTAGCCRSTSRI